MSAYLWIQNGHLLDPANQIDEIQDLYVAEGRIVPQLSDAEKNLAKQLDAQGLMVTPGLVDLHARLGYPGPSHRETIATGTQAAAAGGFTSLLCMPDTSPLCDNAGTLQQLVDKVIRDACVRVYPTGCLTKGLDGVALAPSGQLQAAGAVALSDSGAPTQNNEIMRRALEYAHMFDMPVLAQSQDSSMTDQAMMHEGEWSLRLGLKGWPKVAESIMVARNVILAELTQAHVHLQNISSAASVEILRRAKARGIQVSAELSPQHLALTDAALRTYDTNLKLLPPLGDENDRRALIEGLKDGTLDCIASGHSPFSSHEKDCEFAAAPFGVGSLETCLSVALEILHHQEGCSLSHIINWLSTKPAKICRLPAGSLAVGMPADICVFDPNEKWVPQADQLQSKSKNSPWIGKTLRGKVKACIVGGKQIGLTSTHTL